MNIEITGRHALLFDDDANAAFVNSDDALVEWNSLLIDRYDVRHLLSTPPPSRRRRNPQTSHSSAADAEIDYERYLDLRSSSDEEHEDAKTEPAGGFNAVPFSYGNYEDSNDQKKAETESEIPRFHPPFPVSHSLAQNLPPTEKVHQIIARTALFVSKNGGQSEIVLRVKQGDNPTFGFLMPDHHLHPYFRFLVDHQDLLQPKYDGQDNDKTSNTENAAGAGALSLLGSVYGSGEDEEAGVEHASSSGECVSGNIVDIDAAMSLATGKTNLSAGKDESSKHSLPSNEDAPILKRSSISTASKAGRTSSMKKGESLASLSAVPDKSRASSLPPIPKTEQMLLDPPSDMKPLVDKIVEFVIKNGRQFEAVLIEQDRGHGRFPFLLPSNIFHPYYLKVLQKAQESKLTIKSFRNEKDEFRGNILKKTSVSRENKNHMVESDDIPVDPERKEKFKMVINKSKKDGSDLPAKATQPEPRVQVDAVQAAAILQAATRGVNHPSLGILFGQPSNEAESSEAQMTDEQKLKAERLKRAKMFVAQLKSGAAPLKAEAPRGFSAEPPGTGADNCLASKDGERSTIPLKDASERKIKSEKEHLNEERRSKRKYRARGEASEVAEVDDDEEEEEDNHEVDERDEKRTRRRHTKKHRSRNHSVEADSEDDERDYKHVKRTHRSHRSSHKHDDMDKGNEERDHKSSRKKKHRSPSSYEDDDGHKSDREYSRKKHRSRYSSYDEESCDEIDSDHEYSRKKRKHRSHRSSHHSRDRHKHSKSHTCRHRQELDVSSEEEPRDPIKAERHKKGSNSEKEELEEGEISSKLSGQSRGGPLAKVPSREPSVDISSQDRRPPSQPIDTTEVPDDLRAKIRAMLMSTM